MQANGDLIELHWEKDVALSEALAATATLGRALSEEFPQLILKLAEPEPTGTVPVGEKTETLTEGTSGSDLEVPESAPSETSSQAPAMPDWLKALQEAPSTSAEPAAEEEAERVGEEMEVTAPAPLETSAPVEPEKPQPIQVNSAIDIAKMIKEDGVGEVQFGQFLLRQAVEETFARIIAEEAKKGPKPTVNTSGFTVSSGFILRGSVAVATFNIPFSLIAGPKFNYVSHTLGNIPTIPVIFPADKRDALVRKVDNRVRAIQGEIAVSLKAMVEQSRTVRVESVENLRIEDRNTIATFRGKPINR